MIREIVTADSRFCSNWLDVKPAEEEERGEEHCSPGQRSHKMCLSDHRVFAYNEGSCGFVLHLCVCVCVSTYWVPKHAFHEQTEDISATAQRALFYS